MSGMSSSSVTTTSKKGINLDKKKSMSEIQYKVIEHILEGILFICSHKTVFKSRDGCPALLYSLLDLCDKQSVFVDLL